MVKKYTIVQIGDVCPKCSYLLMNPKTHIKHLHLRCDSHCMLLNECQTKINLAGLKGFVCKAQEFNPKMVAVCDDRAPWKKNGCTFVLDLENASHEQSLMNQWIEKYVKI